MLTVAITPRQRPTTTTSTTAKATNPSAIHARLRRAEEILETTDLPVDLVADRAGFGSADTLRHHFAARRGVGPAAHRRQFMQ